MDLPKAPRSLAGVEFARRTLPVTQASGAKFPDLGETPKWPREPAGGRRPTTEDTPAATAHCIVGGRVGLRDGGPNMGTICLALFSVGACWANTYTVTNTNNSGWGSLRWAIERANSRAGADTILFSPDLVGHPINPTSALPPLTDSATVLGDVNDDDAPDIVVSGLRLASADGLALNGDNSVVDGLVVTNFAGYQLSIVGASYCLVKSCHLGTDLLGTRERITHGGLHLDDAQHCQIGGTSRAERNVIAGSEVHGAIRLDGSHDNTIAGNNVGVSRDGSAVLTRDELIESPRWGLNLYDSDRNAIGGTTADSRNLFAGLNAGVTLSGSQENTVQGNWFGLAENGDTSLPLLVAGVGVSNSPNNTIGGPSSLGARNVFAGGADYGVVIHDDELYHPASTGTVIQGNYFGLNAAGTAQRSLAAGVAVRRVNATDGNPGEQTIGGTTAREGNWFCPKSSSGLARGVFLEHAGGGSQVRQNTFGVTPVKGGRVKQMDRAVDVEEVEAWVIGNTIRRADIGILGSDFGARVHAFRNKLRNCRVAVGIRDGAQGWLGDLSTPPKSDDGGNEFRDIGETFIVNATVLAMKAEGNDFGTTDTAVIDAKIMDNHDNAAWGDVDYLPLLGGTAAGTGAPPLTITAASASPTKAGAAITFSLSTPAAVTVVVVNLAGRTIATLSHRAGMADGAQRLLWSGRTSTGAGAPDGRYLVRITAREARGHRAEALCPLSVDR